MKKIISAVGFILSLIFISFVAANAQNPPSEAQIRKDVMNPGVIQMIDKMPRVTKNPMLTQ